MTEKIGKCGNCIYFRRLKHDFQRNTGFVNAHCCDALMHLEIKEYDVEPWIQEVDENGMREMFSAKEGVLNEST